MGLPLWGLRIWGVPEGASFALFIGWQSEANFDGKRDMIKNFTVQNNEKGFFEVFCKPGPHTIRIRSTSLKPLYCPFQQEIVVPKCMHDLHVALTEDRIF